ncbi:hypothetical protein GCM10020219_052770 [Nonomuraea dietziae]
MRVLGVSFAVLMVTATVQAVIVARSGSVALLGDTLHNFADALTAIPLAIAFTLGRRAATRRFTYGYGRAEDLAGIVIVLLIAASAGLAGYEAVRRLLDPQEVRALAWSPPRARSASSATSGSPATASGSGVRSARPPWLPTACTRAPTASPRSPCSSARAARRSASPSPTLSSAC